MNNSNSTADYSKTAINSSLIVKQEDNPDLRQSISSPSKKKEQKAI